jgi:hypothetical protein
MATSSNAATVATLRTARDNITQIILAQTNVWLANGCPPTFSLDGESYQWNEWLKARNEEIKGLTESIQALSTPWIVRSTGRA